MKEMYANNSQIKIGNVYSVKFDGDGSEQRGLRPAVVFQNNIGNQYSPNVVVLPLTSVIKKSDLPTHVFVPAKDTGLLRDSVVLCENPVCVSKDKLGKLHTKLPDEYMGKIAIANILASGAISFVDPDVLLSAWEKSVTLNEI